MKTLQDFKELFDGAEADQIMDALMNIEDVHLGEMVGMFFLDGAEFSLEFRKYLISHLNEKEKNVVNIFMTHYINEGTYLGNMRMPFLAIMAEQGMQFFIEQFQKMGVELSQDLKDEAEKIKDGSLVGDMVGITCAGIIGLAARLFIHGNDPKQYMAACTGIGAGIATRLATQNLGAPSTLLGYGASLGTTVLLGWPDENTPTI